MLLDFTFVPQGRMLWVSFSRFVLFWGWSCFTEWSKWKEIFSITMTEVGDSHLFCNRLFPVRSSASPKLQGSVNGLPVDHDLVLSSSKIIVITSTRTKHTILHFKT
jgi:hypothetical protein